MHKRVLLAEQSDTIRGVAGAVLRQTGYEVITVATSEKALEVLNFSRPDVLIVGGNLTGRGSHLFFETIKDDSRFSGIPLLVLCEPEQKDLSLSPENIVVMPFDPKEFLDRVASLLKSAGAADPLSDNPLEGADLGDDLIDSALGLDRIEVTDSEVMDKTSAIRRKTARPAAGKTGLGHSNQDDHDHNDSSKVESIMIRDEHQTDIDRRKQGAASPAKQSNSGKLDILTEADQYGMQDAGALMSSDEDAAHDYDWFINSMRDDSPLNPDGPSATKTAATDSDASDELKFRETSSLVDPITPVGSAPNKSAAEGGVDKFIDEFRKEVEKFNDDEPANVLLKPEKSEPAGKEHHWQDSVEKVTIDEVRLFTREFAVALAEKVADKIVDKLDSEKLLNLIKKEILARASRQGR